MAPSITSSKTVCYGGKVVPIISNIIEQNTKQIQKEDKFILTLQNTLLVLSCEAG